MCLSPMPLAETTRKGDVDTFPFTVLRLVARRTTGGVEVARREAGEVMACGSLTIGGGMVHFSGEVAVAAQASAAARAAAWLGADYAGEYPVCRHSAAHRAVVEADGDGLHLLDTANDYGAAAVLGWVAALVAANTGDARLALRAAARLYSEMTQNERQTVLETLANQGIDAGGLFALYLTRVTRESAEEEWERWESWFLGQRQFDLPYDRRAAVDILESDIDPDLKRLAIHEAVTHYDFTVERANRTRIVDYVRQNNQELVFGRMSRAFHNQSLLFANACYVQIDDEIRAGVAGLAAECLISPRLAPAADRLRTLLQGMKETGMTAVIGALELLENAILDDNRSAIDGVLKADREGRATPGAPTVRSVLAATDHLLELCRELRDALQTAPRRPAAFVLLSQRLAPLESHLMVRINELQEPYLGKPDNLKTLVRKGGQRMYSSPDYAWLQFADHWVEAIPLFIKERVLVIDGVEVTETVIDQQILEETFREQFADHWALGLDNVMDSEHLALAREMLARNDERLAGDDRARAAAVAAYGLADGVGAYAAMIAYAYRKFAETIHQRAEREGLSRYDTLRVTILDNMKNDHPHCLACEIKRRAERNRSSEYDETLALLAGMDDAVKAETQRLTAMAHLPRRALPALHVLTTQSARMSDSYVRTWLEESMALFNVIRAHGLDGEVKARINGYREQITLLGARLIRELGMWAEVEELLALENMPEGAAVGRIVAGNVVLSRQLAILAVLAEQFDLPLDREAPLVDELLLSRRALLQGEAVRAVYERNDLELLPKMDAYIAANTAADEAETMRELIAGNPEYAEDLEIFLRFAAREAAVRELDHREPDLHLAARILDWLRNHSRLALTTARREVLLEHGLNHLTMHPLYYYRATGGNKRYHQLYTPSRVDLGIHERESVETWSQWVGGADKAASRAGRRVFALINKNPKMFDSLTEPEVIKTGENASMVANFSYANAMSLLVNSVGCGDIEELGDQMNLRHDRRILPGGEGYGGYCVPKDGLFLEFVLILTRATKLRQLGIPDHLHAGVVKFAHALLNCRSQYSDDLAWEAHAMKLVANREELGEFFTLRDSEHGDAVPIFQITRIARALTQLGRPELTDSFEVLSNLAARWGIHKVIVGGEQVNRFMPFYKVWSTYRLMEDARRLNPDIHIRVKDFSVVLSAEYKPNTQDGRYSVGMRKFELFAGTGEHLTYSLDAPGQDLAYLMFHGFSSLWEHRQEPRLKARLARLLADLSVREEDAETIARLCALFPGEQPPGEIRMVSPMMLTTSDLLHYTSDTQLEHLAQEAKRRLQNCGLTENEITANMQVYGPRLQQWTKLRALPAEQLATLTRRIGGAIHALALSILGPAGNYEMVIQGADVLDTGIPHDQLLALLDDPVKLRDMMLMGHPNSALGIIDGASGARHRAMNRLAVMRWFAAGEAIGRQALYRCMGIGADTIENWRADMHEQRARAKALHTALVSGDADGARTCYTAIVSDLRDGQESALFLETEERMMRFHKETAQETATARALSRITAGLPLEGLDFGAWLALGGQFMLIGCTQTELDACRQSFEKSITALGGQLVQVDEPCVAALVVPAFVPAREEFREEKGIESSNKATEEVAAVAMDTRKRLAERVARARAMNEREQAFTAVLERRVECPFDELVNAARATLGDGSKVTSEQIGQLLGLTRLAFIALGKEIFHAAVADAPEHFNLLVLHVETLFTGRDVDLMAIRAIGGGYEDPGDIARLANAVAAAFREERIDAVERDRLLRKVADAAELFDTAKGILFTIDFFVVTPAEPMAVWRALADFFAESINDHFFQYAPWSYSRGDGFTHLSEEELYQLAVEHHTWLYGYLRGVIMTFTEMKERTPEEVVHLLGDMAIAGEQPPIGADANSPLERQWRAYNQLREIAFLRNDGFPLPEVFPQFDPAIIDGYQRTNLLFFYPVGRTHVSRALMEGPTLARELHAQGRPGANLLITRDGEVAQAGGDRPVVCINNAHLYISRENYLAALRQHRGLSLAQAEELAGKHVGPKGVRVAVRFTAPLTAALIIPMHGHAKYVSGQLEDLGLPYSSQSLFHTWTTYDKAKYPLIFHPGTRVELPGEIDWLASYTAQLGEEAACRAIEHGDAPLHFPGIRAFARRFSRIMVKGAAESGGRGQRAFTLRDADGQPDEQAIAEAVAFTYSLSLVQNVAIQEVIIASPEHWATEEFMQSFVDRQVQEWNAVVTRNRRPRTNIYGSLRLVFSTDKPGSGKWHVSHPITLNSRQLITNVGRGGSLDLLRPEFIRPEFRELFWTRLVEAGERGMNALAGYAEIAGAQYREENGREVGKDATGVSYACPRYMMLDFLVQPIFTTSGTLVDLEPLYNAEGERIGAQFILQRNHERLIGSVKDWRVVLLEPNIGIGLWDRLALREEAHFVTGADTPDWDAVGQNARIVLRDLAQAGEEYLQAVSGTPVVS